MKVAYQPSGVRRVRTADAILSVMEANVCPGARTGASGASVTDRGLFAMSLPAREPGRSRLLAQLRVDVSHCGHVHGPRTRVQLREHRVAARLGLQLRDAAPRLVRGSEDDALGGAP